tara:strand:- start:168 stop:656 length:489 start_codon:yes stop_codon:yes gene_type:complete
MVLLNGMKIKYEDGKVWTWREMMGKHKLKTPYWRELKGSVHKGNGYRCVEINYKKYQYHRVVYFIHNDDWDIDDGCRDNSIDHIDRNPLNNSIENLRVVTHSQNMWNQDRKGYTFHKAKGKYEAKIRVDRKDKYLGLFDNEEDARQAYLEAKKIYHVMGDLK